MSAEKDAQSDLLKLVAYASLANLWINLSTKEYDDQEEATSFLKLQEELINEFEKTLRRHLDEAAIRDFRNYSTRYKLSISR